MTLTQEQVKIFKDQLKSQVSHLPPDQKSEALKQIDEMSSEALESLVKQQQSQASSSSDGNSIFRMIVNKEIDSIIVEENSSAIAVMDINPISKGHIMIIPKSPVLDPKDIPKPAFELSQKLTDKITSNLKAKSVRLETTQQFGETIIHLIPNYPNSPELNLQSPRSKGSPEELSQIANQIKKEVIKISTTPQRIKLDKNGLPIIDSEEADSELETKENDSNEDPIEPSSDSPKEKTKKKPKVKKEKVIKLKRRIP